MKKILIATLAAVALSSTAVPAGAQSRYNGPNNAPAVSVTIGSPAPVRGFDGDDRGRYDRFDRHDRYDRHDDDDQFGGWTRRNDGVRGMDTMFFPGRIEAPRCNPRWNNCFIDASPRSATMFCRANGFAQAVYFTAGRRGALADVLCR